MSKQKDQASRQIRRFQEAHDAAGIMGDKLPEGGIYDAGDYWLVAPPDPIVPSYVAVVWTRLASLKEGQQRRRPLGEKDIVAMDWLTFLELLARAQEVGPEPSFVLQMKATQTLSITKVLAEAKSKLAFWKLRRAGGTHDDTGLG